ncbi:MAG: Nitronate monooxygenase, partial [Planctomycetaceae bacterium]|nr:Nitronate monooxygenase [Planctomycetaceae bacterium]
PMAGISTPEMAAAVSNAGGLGSIGVGNVKAEGARQQIREVRELTDRPFNVNVFCHQPAVADMQQERDWLKLLRPHFERFGAQPPGSLREIYTSFLADDAMQVVLLEERPAVVSFHFGLPSGECIAALKAAGIFLLATATSLAEARLIHEAGLDAVIAQGYEAGGHRGLFEPEVPDDCLGTLALTRLLVSRLPLPVIAAGGIMDGAGIAASLFLGASAAQLGTAFILSPESAADSGYRAALQSPAAEHTRVTTAISGRPARSLPNHFTALGIPSPPPRSLRIPLLMTLGKHCMLPRRLAESLVMGPSGPARGRLRCVLCLPASWWGGCGMN